MITQNRVKFLFKYDEHTGKLIRRFTQSSNAKAGDIVGNKSINGQLDVRIDYKLYKVHRIIWLYVYGVLPDIDVDHINGIKTDNRLCNLRLVNRSENLQNQRKARSDNKSGLLGVSHVTRTGMYIAQIQVNKKHKYIGSFYTAQDAHDAYLKEKRKLHSTCTI